MRRTILFAFFLLAACGGGVRSSTPAVNPTSDMRAEAQRVLFSQEAQDLLAELAKSSSQDALDTCVNAWLDDPWGAGGDMGGEFKKPNVAGLRSFLSRCLATTGGDAPVPAAGVRARVTSEMKADQAGR